MKKINQLLIFSVLITIFSCNDAIDIEQPGRLGTENAFRSVEDLQRGLLGAYNFLDTTNEIGFTSSFTDEVFRGRDNGGQNLSVQNFNINLSNSYASAIWNSYYGAINLANRIIAASENISRSSAPNEYDNILAQTYAIRAFSHFQIMTYFAPSLEDSEEVLSGLLLTSETTDIFASVPRSSNRAFYMSIASDIAIARDLLNTDLGNKFITQDFLTALSARMEAYRGNYVQADAFASQLLANYPIADRQQYIDMYDDADDTEIIFALERNIGDSYDGQAATGTAGGGWAGSLYAFVDATAGGGPYMEMSRSTFNLLNGTFDVRLERNVNLDESSIDPNYATNPNFRTDDVLLVFKYPGSDNQPLLNDLKVFRSSEMLLIRAEAAADDNRLADAAGFIQELQNARYGGGQPLPVYANQTEAFGDILDERRLEFLFEGHRWVDLKRLGDRGNRAIDRDPTECALLSGCTLPNSDFRFALPIPLSEVTPNSEIQQNPGY